MPDVGKPCDNGYMTIATPERYQEMLDAARKGGYAYPAINVTSSQTLNAALQGFADAQYDGLASRLIHEPIQEALPRLVQEVIDEHGNDADMNGNENESGQV